MEGVNFPIPETIPHWQLFAHDSDIGVRGFGATLAEAFEQAAIALNAMVTEPHLIEALEPTIIHCAANDPDFLFMDWLNAVIYEMVVNKMLFSKFEITIQDLNLHAKIWGEPIDRERHQPAVEPKGTTFTELKVMKLPPNIWVAQCVVDV